MYKKLKMFRKDMSKNFFLDQKKQRKKERKRRNNVSRSSYYTVIIINPNPRTVRSINLFCKGSQKCGI